MNTVRFSTLVRGAFALALVVACFGCSSKAALTEDVSALVDKTAPLLGLGGCRPVGGRVLLVHSYYSDYPWVNDITEGVEQGLKNSKADLHVFYMDTKRQTSEEWKQEAGRQAKDFADMWMPDVIIAADDNAQEYFAAQYAGQEGAPQIVFCGVNAEPEKYGYPAANVTGLLERPFWDECVDMLLEIAPDVNKIALLTDKSTTSDEVVAYVESREQKVELVSIDQPETFAEWQEVVARYQTDVDAFGIYVYHTVKEEIGQDSMNPTDVMDWILANNTKPLFAMLPFAVEDGALFGMVESGQEHGRWAGEIAVKILKGKDAGDFPIETATESSLMVNLNTAAALGIEISDDILNEATIVGN